MKDATDRMSMQTHKLAVSESSTKWIRCSTDLDTFCDKCRDKEVLQWHLLVVNHQGKWRILLCLLSIHPLHNIKTNTQSVLKSWNKCYKWAHNPKYTAVILLNWQYKVSAMLLLMHCSCLTHGKHTHCEP